ncbi:MAG: type III-B CRISPR module-associated Cmr3 family protein, partial [Nevskiales bacterium]
MTVTTLRFTALDTLFFRESRPFDAIGGSELASLFPPPPRTVAGAIRTAIGESLGADWKAFKKAFDNRAEYMIGGVNLHQRIGFGDDLEQLSIEGIWLSENGERLYPAPLFLLRKTDGQTTTFNRLLIGADASTSLGRVRLPQLPAGCEGYKPLEGVWLTRAGLEKVLAGGVPLAGSVPGTGDIREKKRLVAEEPRLGIARDNSRRTVETGLLYQTRHVRPIQQVRLVIEADVTGLDGLSIDKSIVRLGGEGRMAGIEIADTPSFPKKPAPDANTHGVIVVLLTPARFGGQAWLPTGFAPQKQGEVQVWKGAINGVSLIVHCAVVGKALREGGWDLAAPGPRPVQSLIPAGSSYYCTVDGGGITAAIEALNDKA